MKWSERFSTGISRIDDQHRMLFKMAEDFREALEAGTGSRVYGLLLQSVEQYSHAHFGFEESCMARHVCPAAEINKAAHRQFLQLLASFQRRFDASGFESGDARRFVDAIDDWIENHISRIDVQIKPYVTGHDATP